VDIGGGEFGIQFAVHTFGQRSHPNYPAEFDVLIDNNLDGKFDFAVFNSELGGFGASGQNIVNVVNLKDNTITPEFFTDADLNSANAILTAPLADLGLTPDQQFGFAVVASDNYFTGATTDFIEGMVYTAGRPKFTGGGLPASGVPPGGASLLNVARVPGGDAASPSQTGLLLMYRDGQKGREADTIEINARPQSSRANEQN